MPPIEVENLVTIEQMHEHLLRAIPLSQTLLDEVAKTRKALTVFEQALALAITLHGICLIFGGNPAQVVAAVEQLLETMGLPGLPARKS